MLKTHLHTASTPGMLINPSVSKENKNNFFRISSENNTKKGEKEKSRRETFSSQYIPDDILLAAYSRKMPPNFSIRGKTRPRAPAVAEALFGRVCPGSWTPWTEKNKKKAMMLSRGV